VSEASRSDSSRIPPLVRRAVLGSAAGLFAGIPQVLAAQAVGGLAGDRSQADVGPRFVQRAAWLFRRSPSRPQRWSLATLFHFGYAAGWGAAYGPVVGAAGAERVPPLLAGGLLGTFIYGVAFSRFGAGTRTFTERHPDRRNEREWAVLLTSAFSYALVLAYSYRWLDGQEWQGGAGAPMTRSSSGPGRTG
jgi:hypothetical protein